MSENINSYARVLEELQRDLAMDLFEKSLWEKVEIVKKKDGTDFSVRAKSFKNAVWTVNSWQDSAHPVIEVSGRDNKVGYQKFQISCYINSDDLRKDDPRQTELNYGTVFIPTYIYKPDEVKKLIQDRIKQLDARIQCLEKQIEVSQEIYNECLSEIKSAFDKLRSRCDDIRIDKNTTSLEIYIADAVENKAYRYMKG